MNTKKGGAGASATPPITSQLLASKVLENEQRQNANAIRLAILTQRIALVSSLIKQLSGENVCC